MERGKRIMIESELIRFEMDEDFEIDELVECNIENLKIENEENIILLQNLLKEVCVQIKENKPNLIKLKGMIN